MEEAAGEVADWLAFITDVRGLQGLRGTRPIYGFMKTTGPHRNSVSAGIYTLSAWTHGLALQINIHRHLILPSVKWSRVERRRRGG